MARRTTEGLKGLDKVLRNLTREANKIEGRTMKGLIRAAIIIRRDMDKTSPKIPVDEGNLRAGYFVVTSKGEMPEGGSPKFTGKEAAKASTDHGKAVSEAMVIIGKEISPALMMVFPADYAVFVHEMVGTDAGGSINWNRPGSGAKFFEASVKRNTKAALMVIAEEAKIK